MSSEDVVVVVDGDNEQKIFSGGNGGWERESK